MAEDFSEKIKALLSDPDAMNMISSMLSSKDIQNDNNEPQTSDYSNEISAAISKFNSIDDKRINLLKALKPYMRQSRSENIDKALKMLKITQMTSLFKDL